MVNRYTHACLVNFAEASLRLGVALFGGSL